ncbi:energy transducer TonB [Denitratimonas sp. CY0512]|uniref:energy transducer TonB n=1 Tax=Denitratimonas sp. CY0512 TaxID=3131940 RepID=UPI0030A65111
MRNSLLRTMCGLVLFLVAGVAMAAGARASGKQLEASMRVSGEIHIATDGSVESLELNHEEELERSLAGFIRQTIMAWRFEPIMQQGVAVPAKAPVSLRLTAVSNDEGEFRAFIRSASFEVYDPQDATQVRWEKNRAPTYPNQALRAGVQGDVHLALKIGPDGGVEDAAVRQVNLLSAASDNRMKRWRGLLSDASLKAVRDWRFLPPTEGESAAEPYWLVSVPVSFRLTTMHRAKSRHEGTWTAYVPGPLQPLPWLSPEDVRNATSPEALADGGVYMIGDNRGPKLLTPLDPG